MSAYAPNFTARLRVKYTAAGAIHTQTWRVPSYGTLGINIAALRAAVENIWSDLQPRLYDDVSCVGCTYAVENSNIFLPTDAIVMSGDIVTPTTDPRIKAFAVSLVGRTALGQPAKNFFYGMSSPDSEGAGSENYRINPGENADVDAAIATANGFLAGLVLCGSDGTGVTWYPYANTKPNDYWVKRVRQGA